MASHEHDADMTPVELAEGEKKEKEHGHGHSHDHAHGQAAKIVALGTVEAGGATFTIDREGQVEAGKDTEFGVEIVGGAAVTPTEAWIENPDGEKLCEPVSGEGHDDRA